jgi:hypothetical protein
MLTTSDVTSLALAFSPQTPTNGNPSLVRSASGNSLISSVKILSLFRTLLKTCERRIKTAQLSSLLQIQSANWILDCYEGPLYLSQDQQTIIPDSEIDKIREELHATAEEDFISFKDYGRLKDLSFDSLNRLCNDLDIVETGLGEIFVARKSLVESTKHRINERVAESAAERLNLTTTVSGVPQAVLIAFTTLSPHLAGGSVDLLNDEVVFMPAGYEAARASKERAARESQIDDIVRRLLRDGVAKFSIMDDSLLDEVTARYTAKVGDEIERSGEKDAVHLSSRNRLAQVMEMMKQNLAEHVELPPAAKSEVDSKIQSKLVEQSPHPNVASFILNSKYRAEIDDFWRELNHERIRTGFQLHMRDHVMGPLQLYRQGIQSIQNPALQQRLDVYIMEHFKQDTMAQFKTYAHEHGIVQVDKQLAKECERMQQASKSAQSLVDLETDILRSARKCKITPPTLEEVVEIKRSIMSQKLRAMHRMSRASDVLQNTTWILLADKCEGLFMSSGKDTTRMIKQYQLVGDGETAERLEQWRDILKSGAENKTIVQDMLELASNKINVFRAESG